MTNLALRPSVAQLVLDLEATGALTPVSLDLPEETTLDQYDGVLYFIGTVKKGCSWWAGDAVIFGEGSYGHEVEQVADSLGLAPETVGHYASVCAKIPRSRRRPTLSFGVHALVRDCSAGEQKRWLDRAEKNDWGTRELKEAMDEAAAKARGEQQQIEGTQAPAARKVDKALVVEVAYAIVRDAKEIDDGFVAIPVETMARLRSALGEE